MLKLEDGGGRILKIADGGTITKLCESKENKRRKAGIVFLLIEYNASYVSERK